MFPEFIEGRTVWQIYFCCLGKAIVWVNTTAKRKPGHLNELLEFNDQVIARNKLVGDFSTANGIPILDFYSVSINNVDYYEDDGIQFIQAGIKAEVGLITEEVRQILK